MNAGVALRDNRGVAAGCLVGQTCRESRKQKAESRKQKAERGRVVGKNNKAANPGSLIVIYFLYPPIDSKSGLVRAG